MSNIKQKLFNLTGNRSVRLHLNEAHNLAARVLYKYNTQPTVSNFVASALVSADADGLTGHGLMRIPSYVEQLVSKKLDGSVIPKVRYKDRASIEVDARGGFAYPAIQVALKALISNRSFPAIAMAGILNSHHCGVAGHIVEKLAKNGRIGLMISNTPKAMAPPAGNRPLFGTNPIAFACPRKGAEPIIVDLSLTMVARGTIKEAEQENKPIPDNWATDRHGNPTTDPKEALEGQLNAIGGIKGAALGMMIEILAGAFLKSNFGYEASSFFSDEGESPRTGQLIISIDPYNYNPDFLERTEQLVGQILNQPNTRLPGQKRILNRKIALKEGLRYRKDFIDRLREMTQ